MTDVISNLKLVQQKISEAEQRRGRMPGSVQLVAVTKTVPPEVISQVADTGLNHFGESRVQELLKKQQQFPDAHWHMIGHLQTNKIKQVLGKTALIHSLDRWPLAETIHSTAANMGIKARVLVQANISGEKTKYGLPPVELEDFILEASRLAGIEIFGLMTMAPFVDNPEEVRPVFRELNNWRNKLSVRWPNIKLLSMGMTNDYVVAVEEGADIVRVGSAIFYE